MDLQIASFKVVKCTYINICDSVAYDKEDTKHHCLM